MAPLRMQREQMRVCRLLAMPQLPRRRRGLARYRLESVGAFLTWVDSRMVGQLLVMVLTQLMTPARRMLPRRGIRPRGEWE